MRDYSFPDASLLKSLLQVLFRFGLGVPGRTLNYCPNKLRLHHETHLNNAMMVF